MAGLDFSITKEDVFSNANTALITTRQKRYQNIRYSSEVKNGRYLMHSEIGTLSLDITDEIILYIVLKFRFAPVWMVRQWYQEQMTYIDFDPEKKIREFIQFGLLYELPSATDVFLMPTNRLASMFGIELGDFCSPPYNTLNHTISEQQVMFDCMMGTASYISDKRMFPFASSLGLGRDEQKTLVIPESDYSLRSSFIKNNITLLNDQESALIKEMLEGKRVTTVDMKQQQLVIHKKVDVDEYDFKVPDLSILAPRVLDADGVATPQSIALEVELTDKGVRKYEHLLDLYYDNNKFGYCIYLTPERRIKDHLMTAIDTVFEKADAKGREQTCRFEIAEFEIPYDDRKIIMGDYD